MENKFGKYINELMLMVIEKREGTIVHQLAVDELRKLANDILDFLEKQTEKETKSEKTLLQENK
tara:strand:+ start:2547 stop:2738 length:192 start_codon:yes stop_codon:yes gene_type:complete